MNITLIEDDEILVKHLSKKIKQSWYNVNSFNSFNEFMNFSDKNSDFFLVDIWLLDWSWLDIIKYLREEKKSDAWIIITSSYDTPENKIYWLDIWADDYIAKPFAPEELIARIRAVIRRKQNCSTNSIIEFNNIKINLKTREFYSNNKKVLLTPKEKQLIEYFIINKWILVKKNDLISSVWGNYDNSMVTDNTINATISKIKKKLAPNFKLTTIFWEWYILEE